MDIDMINQTRLDTVLLPSPGQSAETAQKKQFAADFETLFIEKLLDEMKNTIGNWGFEQDAAAKQIQGLFWMYLAKDVAQNGGVGMSKDIYQWLNQSQNTAEKSETLDKQL